ncbi:stanniocalcin-like [Babylonia areolata]|uniref:stanniocalcin-like n=1 Tax=Babylonia areolata TaxID=304850 RepID=UPI003FD1F385
MKVGVAALVLLMAGFTWASPKSRVGKDISSDDDRCVEKGNAGDCEFWRCFEERHPCGRQFDMQIACHKCEAFYHNISNFTEQGQTFLRRSMLCFLNSFSRIYYQNIECATLRTMPLQNSIICILREGFCDFINDNLEEFLMLLQNIEYPDHKTFTIMSNILKEEAQKC